MSGSDRGDRGALVALALVVSAIVIIFLFGGFGNPANEVVQSATQPNSPQQNAQDDTVQAVHWGVLTIRDTLAQWIAAIAAIGSAAVSFWAVRLVRSTLRETRRAAHAAITANRNTLKAINQEQVHADRQQRAYIGVESILLDCPSARLANYKPAPIIAGANITDFVNLNIQNFGATPANKVYTWVNWFVAPYPESLPVNFTYPDVATPMPPGIEISIIETSLFPSQKFLSRIAMTDVTPVILSNAKKAFVYFYGKIVYTDITNTERFTYFCFRHIAGRQPGQEMERYGDHNDAT